MQERNNLFPPAISIAQKGEDNSFISIESVQFWFISLKYQSRMYFYICIYTVEMARPQLLNQRPPRQLGGGYLIVGHFIQSSIQQAECHFSLLGLLCGCVLLSLIPSLQVPPFAADSTQQSGQGVLELGERGALVPQYHCSQQYVACVFEAKFSLLMENGVLVSAVSFTPLLTWCLVFLFSSFGRCSCLAISFI